MRPTDESRGEHSTHVGSSGARQLTPWTDVDFASAVRQVVQEIRLSPDIVLGTGKGAIVAERLLRERGYEHARVIDARDVDEAISHIAHWRVLRDG